ncbi:MAG: hypothetical protein ACKVZH_25620 [Blastocatellia bacterium]
MPPEVDSSKSTTGKFLQRNDTGHRAFPQSLGGQVRSAGLFKAVNAGKEYDQSLAVLDQMIENLALDAARPHLFFHSIILVEGEQKLFADAPGEIFDAVEIVIEVGVDIQTIISSLSSWIDRIVPVSTHCM